MSGNGDVEQEPFFVVAASGWDHDGWQGAFYPDDLPREWRLTYYANEFAAVLIPSALWSAATDDEVVRWREDTITAFRFFLGWEGTDGEQAALPRVTALLGDKCGGVLATTATTVPTTLSAGVFLPQAPAVLQPLTQPCTGVCWWAEPDRLRCAATGLRSVRLRGAVDARRLRDIVQLLAQGDRGGVLVVEGRPPRLATLNAATTIAALLGV